MLTLDDIAKELKVSQRSVYRLIRSGELPAIRVGNLWRVREEDFEAYKRGENESGRGSKNSRKSR